MKLRLKLRRPTLALITAATLLVTLIPVTATHAQDGGQDADRTLSVSGIGRASGSPDVANLELGVEIRNADVGAAVSEANSTMQAVTDALQEAGIAPEDIQTTQFNVRQEQQRPVEAPASSGAASSGISNQPPSEFVVRNIVRITLRDLDRISDIIQTGLDAGANNVYGLNFGLENPDELQATARQSAIENAQMKAQALADGFGMSLGAPVAISEGGARPGPVAETTAFDVGGAGGPPISQGELTVTVQVSVTYELLP
jgi:hypothetical protein